MAGLRTSDSNEGTGSLSFGLRLPTCVALGVLIALMRASLSSLAGQPSVPTWLEAHVGEGEGQIAPVVLERARALYQRKAVRNPCYFAMDATRPHDLGGGLGRRFYIICEAEGSFRAISAGHGGGRDLDGMADFANGRRCVKNFGNAMDSDLTMGGAYVTADIAEAFKGYYRASGGGDAVFTRAFLKFDGEGETANARERAIGGHPAVLLRGVCRRRDPGSPHADQDGYVPFGKLVDYVRGKTGGGNAGHNGLKSLSEHLGNDYRRVRIGIGHPGDKALVHNYVLSDFAKAETAWVAALCDAIAAHAGLLVKGEDEAFQRKVQQAMETAGYGKAAPI